MSEVQKLLCVEAGVFKTLEFEQKGVNLADDGRCKWHGCESACGEGRECRGRAGVAGAYGKCWAQKRRLDRISAWNGHPREDGGE